MGELRRLVPLGNPVLRARARKISVVTSPEVQDLIDDLVHTLDNTDGVGLAAPQVGVSLRLFIVSYDPGPEHPEEPRMETTAIINPSITSFSADTEKDWEGCLSIPGIRGLVPRYRTITLRYQERDGRSVEKEFTGFIARICQHEYDHLEGLVYLDRLESTMDIVSEAYLGEPAADT